MSCRPGHRPRTSRCRPSTAGRYRSTHGRGDAARSSLRAATGATPAAGYSGHIAVFSVAGVLPAERVNILAPTKQAPDQPHLLSPRRCPVHQSAGCRCGRAPVHSRGHVDRWKALGETEQCPQTLVLGAQTLDFASGLIEPVLEIAFGHVRTGRALYVPRLSALPTPCRQASGLRGLPPRFPAVTLVALDT